MLDRLLNAQNLLVFGHIVGAILLLGPLTAASSRFPAVMVSTGHPATDIAAVAAELHRTTRTYGTAAVVVPVLGLVLALRNDVLAALWVQAALGMVALAGALLFAIVLLEQSRLIARIGLEESEQVGASDVARLRAGTGLLALTWVAIVLFMVAKPS